MKRITCSKDGKLYFKKLINEQNKRRRQKATEANRKKVERITRNEVAEALKKMKNTKAVDSN